MKNFFLFLMLITVNPQGCFLKGVKDIDDKMDYVMRQFDRALNTFENATENTLPNEINNFKASITDGILPGFTNEVNRITQNVGIQTRCSFEFMKREVVCELRNYRIKAFGILSVRLSEKKQKKYTEKYKNVLAESCKMLPTICDITPAIISYEGIGASSNMLALDGFYLTEKSIKVWGLDGDRAKIRDLTHLITYTSKYKAILLLYDNGDKTISSRIKRIKFYSINNNGEEESIGSEIQVTHQPPIYVYDGRFLGRAMGSEFRLVPGNSDIIQNGHIAAIKLTENRFNDSRFISSIQIKWKNRNPNREETSTDDVGRLTTADTGSWINFDENERIISLRAGCGCEHQLIEFLQFTIKNVVTGRTRTLKYGKPGRCNDKPNKIIRIDDNGQEIIGLFGRANEFVYGIGPIYRSQVD